MFRDETQEKFGIGSVIIWIHTYLVIQTSNSRVGLLNLNLLNVIHTMNVEDITHLTRNEVAGLVKYIDSSCGMGDFTFKPNAFKKISDKEFTIGVGPY